MAKKNAAFFDQLLECPLNRTVIHLKNPKCSLLFSLFFTTSTASFGMCLEHDECTDTKQWKHRAVSKKKKTFLQWRIIVWFLCLFVSSFHQNSIIRQRKLDYYQCEKSPQYFFWAIHTQKDAATKAADVFVPSYDLFVTICLSLSHFCFLNCFLSTTKR